MHARNSKTECVAQIRRKPFSSRPSHTKGKEISRDTRAHLQAEFSMPRSPTVRQIQHFRSLTSAGNSTGLCELAINSGGI